MHFEQTAANKPTQSTLVSMTDSLQCSVCHGYSRNYLQKARKNLRTFDETVSDKESLEKLRNTCIEDGVEEAKNWSDLKLLELAEEALEQLEEFKSICRLPHRRDIKAIGDDSNP